VGLHARLLEQPPVLGQLALVHVLGAPEGDRAPERPALGVLAVEGLVQRNAERAQDVAARDRSSEQVLSRAEQLVGLEVDPPRVQLDVAGVGEAGADQRPYRVQALQDPRELLGEVLVERVQASALGGGAVQLLHERRRAGGCGSHQPVTARG
jgi:uncharacterized protein (DUF3084 family)